MATACLGACVSTPNLAATVPAPAAQPRFDPMSFFSGHLVGEGRLSVAFSGTVATHVESHGSVTGGVLHLVQQVTVGNDRSRTREWTIRKDRPNHYVGTLTDAQGPVTGEVVGNRLHLSFTMKKGGLPAEQWLTLSPDGRRAYNVLKARKFGIPVAALAEDIRKVD